MVETQWPFKKYALHFSCYKSDLIIFVSCARSDTVRVDSLITHVEATVNGYLPPLVREWWELNRNEGYLRLMRYAARHRSNYACEIQDSFKCL